MRLSEIQRSGGRFVSANDPAFTYMGRIDFTQRAAPCFIWAGSLVRCRFTGTGARVLIRNLQFYGQTAIGYLLDGVQGQIRMGDGDHGRKTAFALGGSLEPGEHELILFKRKGGSHYFEFLGLLLDAGGAMLPAFPLPARKIEVFGDSVSAGEVTEATDYAGHTDPEGHDGAFDNAWFSYPLALARKLDAQVHVTAQGGIALLDGTGYFGSPGAQTGMRTAFDKLRYAMPTEQSRWDFSRYTPQVVLLALGQNDAHPNPDCLRNPAYKRSWKDAYLDWLRTLRGHYPKALFVVITTVLMHERIWDEALDEVVAEASDEQVRRFYFSRNGAVTPGHPRINEQEEMATELAAFLRGFGERIWE